MSDVDLYSKSGADAAFSPKSVQTEVESGRLSEASLDARYAPIGAGGASAWGDLTGTLSDQADLQAALDAKLATASAPALIASVADPYRYNISSDFLGKWMRARAEVMSGTADAKILFIGDSTTASSGAVMQSMFPARAGETLAALGIPCAPGMYPSGSGRWTMGAGWSAQSIGINDNGFIGTDTAGALVFDDTLDPTAADTYDVYYGISGLGGTLTATATGGTPVVQATNVGTAGNVGKITVTASAASATNTVSITASGTVRIIGAEARLSTEKRVSIANWGIGGISAVTYAANAGNWKTNKTLEAYAPDLTVIALGLNDAQAGKTQAEYLAAIATIVGWAAPLGDVMILTCFPTSAATRTLYASDYVPGLLAAYSESHAFLDNHARFGGAITKASNLGMMEDDTHPNVEVGYPELGRWVGRALADVS